jgi:chemotaxis protein MotB
MSRRAAAPHEEEEHENHERWLVTYADVLTLLMVLFIVLFSMSEVDKRKFEQLRAGFQEQFGNGPTLLDGGNGLREEQATPEQLSLEVQAAVAALDEKRERDSAVQRETSNLEEVQHQITRSLTDRGLADSVRFRIDERGLVVTVVTDQVLFELGSADLRPAGRTVLDAIGPALVPMPNPVTVEGHTDDLPINGGRFQSNWELSTERATKVLRYLIDAQGLPPARMSAAGYADTRPIAENTPATRGANRRVVVIVRAIAATAPAPAPPGAPPAVPAHTVPPPAVPPPATAAGPNQEQH